MLIKTRPIKPKNKYWTTSLMRISKDWLSIYPLNINSLLLTLVINQLTKAESAGAWIIYNTDIVIVTSIIAPAPTRTTPIQNDGPLIRLCTSCSVYIIDRAPQKILRLRDNKLHRWEQQFMGEKQLYRMLIPPDETRILLKKPLIFVHRYKARLWILSFRKTVLCDIFNSHRNHNSEYHKAGH